MSRNHRRRTLGFERLETRRLLAGDVNYSVANNTLTLTGDNAANAILITSSSDGVILVKGLVQVAEPVAAGQVAQPTTIGGNPSKFFLNINSIVINFNGGVTTGNKGDDAVVITNLTLNGSVNIHTSDGDDIVALGQFDNSGGLVDAAVNSSIGPLTINNGLTINVQTGDNKIVANKVSIQGAAGTNLGITGGDGSDAITLTNVSVAHATSITDNGAATLTVDHYSTNVLAVSLGIGNDDVSFSNSTINSSANISTNFGNDVVSMDHVIVGTLSVNLGPGNDGLTLSFRHFLFNLPPAVGDSYEIPAVVSIDAGDGNDSVALNTVDASPLTIMMGAGNDQLTIDNTPRGDALLTGGDGADTMNLDTFAANSLNMISGLGNDTISIPRSGGCQNHQHRYRRRQRQSHAHRIQFSCAYHCLRGRQRQRLAARCFRRRWFDRERRAGGRFGGDARRAIENPDRGNV